MLPQQWIFGKGEELLHPADLPLLPAVLVDHPGCQHVLPGVHPGHRQETLQEPGQDERGREVIEDLQETVLNHRQTLYCHGWVLGIIYLSSLTTITGLHYVF